MTPTIKLFGMLLGLMVLAGWPDRSAPSSPPGHYTVAPYEEPGFRQSHTPPGVVKDRWGNPAWIPFAQAINGDTCCIDLDSAPGEQRRQAIDLVLEETVRPHLAFSLNDYLGAYEQGLRADTYLYHAQWDAFVPHGEQ